MSESNGFDSILQMVKTFVDYNTQPDNVFAQDPMWAEINSRLDNILNERPR